MPEDTEFSYRFEYTVTFEDGTKCVLNPFVLVTADELEKAILTKMLTEPLTWPFQPLHLFFHWPVDGLPLSNREIADMIHGATGLDVQMDQVTAFLDGFHGEPTVSKTCPFDPRVTNVQEFHALGLRLRQQQGL